MGLEFNGHYWEWGESLCCRCRLSRTEAFRSGQRCEPPKAVLPPA